MGYDEDAYTISQRVKGFTFYMNFAGLKPEVKFGLLTLDDVRKWLGEVMENKHRPTAIFSVNERTSAHVLQALNERGVHVPKEMALVGFDDFDLAAVVTPPLTTVAQFPVEIAQRAMGLLLKRIQGVKDDAVTLPAKIMLPVKLIVRASCGEHEKG